MAVENVTSTDFLGGPAAQKICLPALEILSLDTAASMNMESDCFTSGRCSDACMKKAAFQSLAVKRGSQTAVSSGSKQRRELSRVCGLNCMFYPEELCPQAGKEGRAQKSPQRVLSRPPRS